MRGQYQIKLIVALLLAVIASMPVLASTIRWFCDGRVCGVSICCCDQPELDKADPNCSLPEVSATKPALCAAGCNCTAVVTTADPPASTLLPAPEFPAPLLFVLPAAPQPLAPELLTPLTRPALPDYRGPPSVYTALPPSGLRAPPAS